VEKKDNHAAAAGSRDDAAGEGAKALAEAKQQVEEWHKHFGKHLDDVETPEVAYTVLQLKQSACMKIGTDCNIM
jgi:hypothetical protein